VLFVLECQDNPRIDAGKPERLKHRQTEVWSREINKQLWFVYEMDGENVYVLSAWGITMTSKRGVIAYNFLYNL